MQTVKHQQALRCGYTTGSCAAGAAAAAVQLLLTGKCPSELRLSTPKGTVLTLEPELITHDAESATCAVRKDSGDDPDVTNGIRIFARVCRAPAGIAITGGRGVGRVTRPGLACAVGEAAINPAPRAQIEQAMRLAVQKFDYTGGFSVEISAENGEEIAEKTFNSRLGIESGLSILGTSGIVEPMSEQALIDTIRAELNCRFAAGERAVLACPGNYGRDFARGMLGVDLERAVTISNFVGEALDYAVYKDFTSMLVIGHAGKLIKIAAGVMQTHSAYADARQEIFAAHAALCGAGQDTVRRLMECVTVDACLDTLGDRADAVMESIGAKITEHAGARVHQKVRLEWILFTNAHGEIWRSAGASELLRHFTR